MSKNKANGNYSALFAHEFQIPITEEQLATTLQGIEDALRNLSRMDDFLKHIEGRSYYRSEVAVSDEYNGVRIKGQIDLLFGRSYGEYGVVDWKDYESASGSDARLQMCLYAWLLCRNKAWPVADPERIELWEVKLGEARAVLHPINRDSFDELEDFIFRSTDELRALCGNGIYDVTDLENFPHTDNPNSCRFCSYARICREPEPWITTASASTKSKGQTSLLLNIA
jgi:CRISPR/Cas system-associated exonuclease Cas4 (RecB family)